MNRTLIEWWWSVCGQHQAEQCELEYQYLVARLRLRKAAA